MYRKQNMFIGKRSLSQIKQTRKVALGELHNKIFARDDDLLEHKLECEKVG